MGIPLEEKAGSGTINWYPFLLDNPGGWQTRRALELGVRTRIPDRAQFLWLSKSQDLAHKFLHEEWECPCGRKIGPVWVPVVLNELTTTLVKVDDSLKKPIGDLEKLMKVLSLMTSKDEASNFKAKLIFSEGPKNLEVCPQLEVVHTFKDNPSHCEVLRGLREMSEMPWFDRYRAMLEIASLFSFFIEGIVLFESDFEQLGPLHGFFPQSHAVDKMYHDDFAALMALVNFDARLTEREPSQSTDGDRMVVKVTWLTFPRIWAAVAHVRPDIVRGINGPTLYVEFPKRYRDIIELNSYW